MLMEISLRLAHGIYLDLLKVYCHFSVIIKMKQ